MATFDTDNFCKHLNSFSLIMIGVGALIGGGIFSVLGVITPLTGPYSYISYMITGIVGLITVYSYIKLTHKWGSAGGEYSLVKNAFMGTKKQVLGNYVGVLLYFGYVSTMALYSYTFAVYFIHLFGLSPSNIIIILVIILVYVFSTIINLIGVKQLAAAENIMVVTKILILVLFIILGIRFAFLKPSQLVSNIGFSAADLKNVSFAGMLAGSATIVVSYQGFQLIGNASQEMKNKDTGIKTMRTATIIAMVLYVFTAFSAVAVLGATKIVGTGTSVAEIAIANAANAFLGKYGMYIVCFGALLSTASALNATLLGSSRMAYLMAKENLLPKSLGFFNKRSRVPSIAIIITAIISGMVAVVTGGALAIAGLTDLIFIQVFFIINYTNYSARKRTNSKKIWPIIGMTATGIFFAILITYFFQTFESNIYSIIFFAIMEFATIFFIRQKNKQEKIKMVATLETEKVS